MKSISELELNELIGRLVNTNDPEEVRQLYRQWSKSYDRDLDSHGYVAPRIGVALFAQLMAGKSKSLIHDAGCGTGLVGQLLSNLGFEQIEGSDFSQDMLDEAVTKNCYQRLRQADFTQPLPIESDHYDGIVSIGVYTKRFRQTFVSEMLRTLKPGGHMVFSCRPMYFEEVADIVKGLHVEGKLAKSAFHFDDYMTAQQASAYYVALQKRENQ